jgi:hypothetical protein
MFPALQYLVKTGKGDSFHAYALERIEELSVENSLYRSALSDCHDELVAHHNRQKCYHCAELIREVWTLLNTLKTPHQAPATSSGSEDQ